MGLSNSQYDSILRSYEEKQSSARQTLQLHKEEIRTKLPVYYQIEGKESSLQLEKASALMDDDADRVRSISEELELLRTKKRSLLSAAGYPEDFLLPRYSCKTCKDTGFVEGQKCNCFKMAAIELLYEQSGIRELLKQDNFNHLSYEYYQGDDLTHFQNAVETCRGFVNNFNSDYHNLFFYGTVGTGKSFLSGCIARELIEKGNLVIYFSSTKLFAELSQGTFDHKSKDEIASLHSDLYGCDLLIIDDLGTELMSSFVASELFSIINERHLRKRATIISTNLSLMNIQERYSDRVFSRITSFYEICKLTGQDIRMYKKRMITRK